MPASPKLVLGPNPRPELMVGSEVPISSCGNVADPNRLMPTELGVNACLVFAYARSRVKPACCSQVRLGDRTMVLPMETTWLPAESCCGKPSSEPTAPNGLVVGSLWK